jgi:hypothetical protein
MPIYFRVARGFFWSPFDRAILAGGITMTAHDLFEFNRLKLAQLGREIMLFAQFNSRTGYAALRMNHGDDLQGPAARMRFYSPVF